MIGTGIVTFAGKNLADFGVQVSGVDTYGAPSRIITAQHVAGRNGSIVIDEGVYEDIEHVYHVAIKRHLADNISGLRNFLLSVKGYARLQDSYAPDEFYQAVFHNAINLTAEGHGNIWSLFDISFTRKPQRFLKSGEETITLTASGTVTNHTLMDARPHLRVYGHGTLGINSTTLTIAGTSSYTDIDCDLQDAYYGSQNLNQYLTLSPNAFPVLQPGANTFTLGSGITRVIITPRWWRL